MTEHGRVPHKRVPSNFYWDHNECGWVQADAVQPARSDSPVPPVPPVSPGEPAAGDPQPMKPDGAGRHPSAGSTRIPVSAR